MIVTPYVGVWIETTCLPPMVVSMTSLLMWECGLKPSQVVTRNGKAVSLLMWECGLKQRERGTRTTILMSLLMWECGLKHPNHGTNESAYIVTPYVGVWIETML